MALVGGALYDVSDPVHPVLICQISNTVAKLFTGDTFGYLRRSGDTGTEVVLRSIGSGNESVVAGWPLRLLGGPFGFSSAWTINGTEAASAVAATDPNGNQTIQVWLFVQPSSSMLYAFNQPLTDCICRFGIPPPTLSFSADSQYLAAGWPVGKGAIAIQVFRTFDHAMVAPLDNSYVHAVWSPTGHTLYLSALTAQPAMWTPEGGLAPLAGATGWFEMPAMSPDGNYVAYTAYPDPQNQVDPHVYVYDLRNHASRPLSQAMRSDATFVKDGVVWAMEEVACSSGCAGSTQASGKVFAIDTASGAEAQVVFRSGESPAELKSGWSAGQFWPNS